MAAQVYRLLGHILLDISRPHAALAAYEKALEIRQVLESPESPPIADVYDSTARSYTEMGDVEKALEFVGKSMAIHMAHVPEQCARTRAIEAMTWLRAGKD